MSASETEQTCIKPDCDRPQDDNTFGRRWCADCADLFDEVANAELGLHKGKIANAYKTACHSCGEPGVAHIRHGEEGPPVCPTCGRGEVIIEEITVGDASATIFDLVGDADG